MLAVLEAECATCRTCIRLSDTELLRLIATRHMYALKASSNDGKSLAYLLVRYVPSYDEEDRPLFEVAYCIKLIEEPGCQLLVSLLEGILLISKDCIIGVEMIGGLHNSATEISTSYHNECSMCYYLYNFACPTLKPCDCAILV